MRATLQCGILCHLSSALFPFGTAFVIGPSRPNHLLHDSGGIVQRTTVHLSAARYGPQPSGPAQPGDGDDPTTTQDSNKVAVERLQRRKQYEALLNEILSARDPNHIPGAIAKNLDLLLALTGKEGSDLAKAVIDDARSEHGDERASQLEEAIELTLTFADEFVNQASRIDDQNKVLLGRIVKIMADKDKTSREREEALDDLFASERERLTAGFLRHVEGECERIRGAPKMTPDSARLLETLRVIQARVVEELGEDLGEAAQVLGQLIGYETTSERISVLKAGLTVRGTSFAHELKALTEEALEGFDKVPGKADPNLIAIVKEIDESLLEHLEENSEFE